MVGKAAAGGLALLALSVAGLPRERSAGSSASGLQEGVQARIESTLKSGARPAARGDPLSSTMMLKSFYAARSYAPAWSADDGFRPRARELFVELYRADQQGLTPDDYHLATLDAILRDVRDQRPAQPDTDLLAAGDLLLTDAFLLYGSHLLSGRVNASTLVPNSQPIGGEADLLSVLDRALGVTSVGEALGSLRPAHPWYARLIRTLARYRELRPWHPVSAGPTLHPGESGPRVEALAARLAATGDFPGETTEVFGQDLEAAVRRFQARHGLDQDGLVGRATLEALNVPLEQRVEQLRVNLERWRWLPLDLGTDYILVNIPAFELEVVEQGEIRLAMRVVVGQEYRQTPVFTAQMTHLVLNPYWNVPRRIAVQDKLQIIQADPGYLAEQHIRVFEGRGASRREVDPDTIDWARVTPEGFTYQLRQDPGPMNALGRLKFVFPNPFDVYMHDTPARELFAQSARSFSSGCIRLERPIDLAVRLLEGTAWTRSALEAALEQEEDLPVTLPRPVRVYLEYWTAWADETTVHFRADIYGRDRDLTAALSRPLQADPDVDVLMEGR